MSFAMATVRYAGMTRFVVTAKHSSQSCRRSGRAYCRRPFVIYRAVLRRVQPAPALRCPQGAIFNIGTRAAAKDRGQHEGAADLPQIICHHALSFWINRRAIELFCAQVFGIRKGRPFDPQRRLSTIRVINLAGRRHEAHASPGPPSNGSLRSFAPAPSASLSGSPPPPSRFSPTLPPVGAAGPWFLGRL